MNFGPRLRALRLRAGLTQAELAKRADILPHSVYRYEAGRTKPGTDIAQRLAKALRIPLEEFLGHAPRRRAS
jgi:transcriptional regulator with XRE-family HTH domain